MIGKLKGLVDEIEEDCATIDVGGVGYVAYCGARTLAGLPGRGEAVALFVETYVREDMIRLYGFASAAERDWFRLLQSVQGVGAKVALSVVGTLGAGDLADAIALQDRTAIARAPGVGPKVAARIVAELKDRAPAFSGAAAIEGFALRRDLAEGTAPSPVADAVSALVNLGYARDQAALAAAAALKEAGEDAAPATLIRLALKALARG